ncbi:MAG TPA: tetratricopeptide repeat protein [Bryobacteraceae bacterium]|nr:tetratricopeptide repeat protein [Bryobacteraceae bacterium]
MIQKRYIVLLAALAAFVTGVYSNHFGNSFHFDDAHTVVQNPYIRDLSNIPRFFTDPTTSSFVPENRAWRPLVYVSLALDYRMGRSLEPFYFQLSTFLWLLVQLGVMFALFRKVFDLARPHPFNDWAALFATAVYGVHPAMAETVNYVIQRADLFSTLGVVAGIAVWAWFPTRRRYGLYLLPVAAAIASKPPAIVFPALLFLYIWLIENEEPGAAIRRCAPALLVVSVLGWISSAMVPATFVPGATSAYVYRINQPIVLFRYFRAFFLPTDLSADTDRMALPGLFDDDVALGFVFLAVLILVAVRCTRKRENRPIAFGLFWFLVASIPTSVFPLAELENDHRMFFPFVGLAMGICWAAALRVYDRPGSIQTTKLACAAILLALAYGTWQRNIVWHTEESLWYDVTLKSPRNGRGLMNYGLSQMSKGANERALDYFQRALPFNPNYHLLEVNLGIVNGLLQRDAEAERHFSRALQLAPLEAQCNYFYARWLRGKGRQDEAIQRLNTVITANPTYVDASHMLMEIYADKRDAEMLRRAANETLARFPGDTEAPKWLARGVDAQATPESYLNQSMTFYQQRRYEDSIRAAQEALKLKPDFALAWNNIAAAYNAQGKWDEGIAAGEKAVRLAPDNQLAKNNLAWGQREKHLLAEKKGTAAKP